MSSISQCRHEEDMCANKHPENDGCIFNGSRDIQQTSTLGLTDPARVLVLQTEREFRRVKVRNAMKRTKERRYKFSDHHYLIYTYQICSFCIFRTHKKNAKSTNYVCLY